jgi:hypothetical protein
MFYKDPGLDMLNPIRGRKEWWALTLSDIAPWLDTLSTQAKKGSSILLDWIGKGWDGMSDVVLEGYGERELVLPASMLQQLLAELGEALSSEPGMTRQQLGPECVRIVRPTASSKNELCIDIDVGGVIVPISISDEDIADDKCDIKVHSIEQIIRIVQFLLQRHDKLVAREAKFRQAMEDMTAKLGAGVSPLWLRRKAVPISYDNKQCEIVPFAMMFVKLGGNLHWTLDGEAFVRDTKTISAHAQYHKQSQADRKNAAERLALTGAYAIVTNIALELMQDMGLDCLDTIDKVYKSSLDKYDREVKYKHKGCNVSFFWKNGMIDVVMVSESIFFGDGHLKILSNIMTDDLRHVAGRPLCFLEGFPVFEGVYRPVESITISDFINIRISVEPVEVYTN